MPLPYQRIESPDVSQLPPADQLAPRFPVTRNQEPADDASYQRIMDDLRFGVAHTDHMAFARWRADHGWDQHAVRPYEAMRMDPATSVLHYGQSVFEGMKAYRHADNSIWTFRPGFNAARFQHSCRRLALPELPIDDFLGSLAAFVKTDQRWVPEEGAGDSLYLRPFMFSSEPFLGMRPGLEVHYYVIASPSGCLFKDGFTPVSIWVTRDYHRAAPGGTGAAKCGGNYGGSLLPQRQAAEKGFSQVCYLDAMTGQNLEELGGMNVLAVHRDGRVETPALHGTILEGGTRAAILALAKDMGYQIVEKDIAIDQLAADIASGEVVELMACGTAAIITPIGRLASDNFDVTVNNGEAGPVTTALYQRLSDIYYGRADDFQRWMYRLV